MMIKGRLFLATNEQAPGTMNAIDNFPTKSDDDESGIDLSGWQETRLGRNPILGALLESMNISHALVSAALGVHLTGCLKFEHNEGNQQIRVIPSDIPAIINSPIIKIMIVKFSSINLRISDNIDYIRRTIGGDQFLLSSSVPASQALQLIGKPLSTLMDINALAHMPITIIHIETRNGSTTVHVSMD